MNKVNLDLLILFDDIRKNSVITRVVKIFNEFFYKDYIVYMEADYYSVQRDIFFAVEEKDIIGSYWQSYVCKLVAESENKFSILSEKFIKNINTEKLMERELTEIKKLYNLDWQTIINVFKDQQASIFFTEDTSLNKSGLLKRNQIKKALMINDNKQSLDLLYDYYSKWGCGIYEKYNAFVWDDKLVGVKNYDKITFDQLVGYEKQKEQLIENTKFFINEYRSNNVLLYGDRGTGKSSSVKALLNEFKDQKLKIISLNKNHIKDLYKIIELVANRGCKFIIFIDDLSFEETEVEYKYFKSVIEGGIEAQPDNVLIYVTSNRRNIIRETWKDRSNETGDVHHNDGIQERMSLADRFGLLITFISPDKKDYLEIVKKLAIQEGLRINETQLEDEALKWELRHNGRSGRIAKQFIYYMKAKMI
ncbi:ATP-binding protein [Anaerovorax odorimutans]|uniref:ATP-binding protein n=1 Tax=Anaerovorax odorimutans TaxID=109327 RepID=UPI0003F882B6|nr:ATP-binding protein [Anaerovorax odorimutans]